MAAQHLRYLTKVRKGQGLTPGQAISEIAEEPRPAKTATSDDHAVNPGLPDHVQSVGGLPDVAVAQYGDRDVLPQLPDCIPVRPPGGRLLRGSTMECDGRAAGFLGDPASIQECLMIMIDADPGLHRHRYAVRRGRADRGGQDHPEPVPFVRQGRYPTFAGDLGDWAPKIQVHIINAVLVAQYPARAPH